MRAMSSGQSAHSPRRRCSASRPSPAAGGASLHDHVRPLQDATINGIVVELRWINPHVTLLVNGTVKDGDPPADWLLEMTSPGNLVRAGGWRATP